MSLDPLENSLNRAAYGTDIDAGLQSHMRRVYNLMCVGLAVTGGTAYAVATIEPLKHLFLETPLAWVAMLAPLGFLLFGFTSKRIASMDPATATLMFVAFSATMGLSMSTIFLLYTKASIARVFLITSGAFAATSLYGYTTKRRLDGMGSFMAMGLFGICIAAFVNLFLMSTGVQWVVSVLGVAIFAGLAAWETQMLKETYRHGDDAGNNAMAIRGALSMYLDFINLFQSLIYLLGDRR